MKKVKSTISIVISIIILISVFCINSTAENSSDIKNDSKFLLKRDQSKEFIFDNLNGLYNIKIDYIQEKSQFKDIKINVDIDSTSIQNSFYLEHVYEYEEKNLFDINGNQILPSQHLYKGLCSKFLTVKDNNIENYSINLSNGKHTVTIKAMQEEFYIVDVKLIEVKKEIEYSEYIKNLEDTKSTSNQGNYNKTYQAESNAKKSEKSIIISNDNNSLDVTPYDCVHTKYNIIGGESWSTKGSFIEWNISVPEDGFYNIAFHTKQNMKLNDNSYRMLTIDGEVPFAEAKNLAFEYNREWQNSTLGQDVPYKFYLTAGKEHTLRLTVSLGNYSHLIERTNQIVSSLTNDYLNILMITGASPDKYRDYKFEKSIPETLESFKKTSKELKDIEKELFKYTQEETNTSELQQMYQLLDSILDDVDTIPSRLGILNSYTSSLQVFVRDKEKQPLALDSLTVYSPDNKINKKQNNIFKILNHHIKQFFVSFTTDYSSIGNIESNNQEKITVWLGSDVETIGSTTGGTGGRDQAQILTRITSNEFSPKSGVSVNVQLVSPGTLLTAVLAKIGPDVALGLGQSTPVNYALRNSIIDLSGFDDIDEVLSNFDESAITPFRLENGIYALPQSQIWPMLFYRKDILDNLGLSLDSLKDWTSIKNNVIPLLEMNFLSFGLSSTMDIYSTLLYQNGGQLYSDDHSEILLDSPTQILSFTEFTNMFLEHGLPVFFNFADRFRNGTMPIGIASYTTYNQLCVYAPEIEGLWNMIPLPSTVRNDGSTSNVAVTTTEGCGIMKKDNIDASWKFLKWWVSTETQIQFAEELETVLGSAARNPTANKNALFELGWDDDMKQSLISQSKALQGIPEVPGGYYSSRYFSFAFTDVVYNGKNIIETLSNVKKDIDLEIAIKTKELLRKDK